jgi:hypothetical protein
LTTTNADFNALDLALNGSDRTETRAVSIDDRLNAMEATCFAIESRQNEMDALLVEFVDFQRETSTRLDAIHDRLNDLIHLLHDMNRTA